MSALRAVLLAGLPMALCANLAWFGVFTFVNLWVTEGLGHSAETWTRVSLWFVAGTVAWQLASTEITRKLGRRTVLLAAMSLTAGAFLAMPHLKTLALLKGVLFTAGMMQAFFISAWFPMVVALGGSRPGRALAAFHFLNCLTAVAMLALGGQLIQRLGFTIGFVVLGTACLAATVAFALATRGRGASVPARGMVSLFRLKRADLAALVAGPFVLVLVLGAAFEPLNFHTVNQLFPNLAREVHHLNTADIGSIVGFGRLSALVSLVVMARLVDRVRPGAAYGLGIMLAAVGVAMQGLAGTAWALTAAYGVYYLGQGTVWGSNGAAVNACVDERLRDVAFSLMSLTLTAGVLLVGALHNALLRTGSTLPRTFIICAMAAASGGAVLAVRSLARRRDRKAV